MKTSPTILRLSALLTSLLRTGLLVSFIGTVAVSAAKGAAVPAASFRADAAGTGQFPGRVPLRRPEPLWVFRTEGPIRGTPLWSEGRVYIGSGDGFFYALDASTGAVRWKFQTGGAADGSPVLASGLVVAASTDGILHALEPATGKEKWRFPFAEEIPMKGKGEGWDFFLSTPAVDGPSLFVGGGDGRVYRLDAATGAERWHFQTGGRVRSSPALAEGVVYVGSFDGHLYALDAETGALRWRFATQGTSLDSEKAGFDRKSIIASPTVSGGVVVVGGRDGFLYGVDRGTGKELWNLDHKISWVVGSAAIRNGTAYVGTSDGRFFQAVDTATGKEVWRRPLPLNVFSSAALAGDVVLFGCHDGALHALDATSGRDLWRYPTGEMIHGSPVVQSGTILIASLDGTLTALAGNLEAPARKTLRAVYADPLFPSVFSRGHLTLRDRLAAEGYETLDATRLVAFLKARIEDRQPSVVVCAGDTVPGEVDTESADEKPLVRRYLEAGGKVVWLGVPPFAATIDRETRRVSGFDIERSGRLLGVTEGYLKGVFRFAPSSAGTDWGLRTWWVTEMGAPAASVEPLSTLQNGMASSWVKTFGGPPGTGFVRLAMRGVPADPETVMRIAEHGLP